MTADLKPTVAEYWNSVFNVIKPTAEERLKILLESGMLGVLSNNERK